MEISTTSFLCNTKHFTNKIVRLTFLVLCYLLPNFNHAQPGTIDTSFNPTDLGFGNGDGANGLINSIALQADGKILIGGSFTSYNGSSRNRIARLNIDGSLDTTFNIGFGANGEIRSIVIQANGKIIIGGDFNSYNGNTRRSIARLNADGTIDTTFDPGTGASGSIYAMTIQNDGKVLIGGAFISYNGIQRNRIARLNSDGSLDTTFNPGTGANSAIKSIAIQGDDKILIGGSFTNYNGTLINRIARLNNDGSLDATFNIGLGVSNGEIRSIVIKDGGKMIIGGSFFTFNGGGGSCIAQLNIDGSLDTTFNPGTGANAGSSSPNISNITIQVDGKLLIGGDFISFNGTNRDNIARLNADGSIDTTFDPGTGVYGISFNTRVSCITIQVDGKIFIGGDYTRYNETTRNGIARLNTNGSLDTNFNTGTGSNNIIKCMAVQGDGKVIIGGDFTIYNGIVRNHIARINSDGSLDTTFNPGIGANYVVNSIALQSDGKVIIGGDFTSFNGTFRNRIARLNTNGSLDTNFNPGTGAISAVYTVAVQGDGKVLVGGDFTSFNGNSRNRIVRLNTNGSLDTTFNQGGSQANNVIQSIILQADGRILIGGDFTSYNGTVRNRLARLNTNGSLDTTFNQGGSGANDVVNCIAIQSVSLGNIVRVLIGGNFTSYNGTATNRIAWVTDGGGLTASWGFLPGSGANGPISAMAVQGDGKVIIGGNFTSYNGTARNYIARLNADGSLDTGFNPGIGANGTVHSVTIQNDGKLLIGGLFTGYNGIGRNRIARINGDGALSNASWEENDWVITYPNPFSEKFSIDISTSTQDDISIMVYDMTGRMLETFIVPSWNLQSLQIGSLYPNGVYNVLINQGKNLKTLRVIKQ